MPTGLPQPLLATHIYVPGLPNNWSTSAGETLFSMAWLQNSALDFSKLSTMDRSCDRVQGSSSPVEVDRLFLGPNNPNVGPAPTPLSFLQPACEEGIILHHQGRPESSLGVRIEDKVAVVGDMGSNVVCAYALS